ncbi:MAG TPA: phenylalanine--tRNA ligase subunit alpha, partial [Rectinemataceae bacterium]
MDEKSLVKSLHPLETRILLSYAAGSLIDAKRVRDELGYKEGQENQAFSWLLGKGLIEEESRSVSTFYELTSLGEEYSRNGTPERRLYDLVASSGALALSELGQRLNWDQKTLGTAFGSLSKAGALALDADKCVRLGAVPGLPKRALELELLVSKAKAQGGTLEEASLSTDELATIKTVAKKRGASDAPFRIAERERVVYRMRMEAESVQRALKDAGITGEELGAISPSILSSGAWKTGVFRSYNIGVSPARIIPGRKNPYVEFLESVKDKLVSLGFEEFDGNMVETEFWNSDALFMPQFHSARDIHDVYYVDQPRYAKAIEEPHLSRVAAAHENGGDSGSRGWNYAFDREFTKRLILRSQGTVLSARQLPTAKVPGKYFGIARCFRYDKVDATHLSDFYQTEGIVLGEDVNLRTLLGFLEMFAVEVAG